MRIRPIRSLAFIVGAVALGAPLLAVTPAFAADTDIRINEIESQGGTPGDWIELINTGTAAVDVSGWIVTDDDPEHTAAIADGTTVASGAFLIIEEADLGFGLGSDDAVQLYLPDGTTLIDGFSWAGRGHAPMTYGRNPDGTGPFVTSSTATKGAANDFGGPVVTPPDVPAVVINEVESNGGVPGDWVELGNTTASTIDVSGYSLRDNNGNNPTITLPAGTTIESGGYLVIDTEPTFGLGGNDAVFLYEPTPLALIDSVVWTAHATTSYGRCPDLTGEIATTNAPTRGLRNDCTTSGPAGPASPWPGSADVATVDLADTFTEDLSGLAYEARPAGDLLWAVQNGDGLLYRLVFDGTNWVPDAGAWVDGVKLRYPDGTGDVDAEGVALTGGGSPAGVYVSSERNNDPGDVSRPSVLLYDVTDPSSELAAVREWNLADDLQSLPANGGIEGITWIADADLVSAGFVDQTTSAPYSPAAYPGHGGGLFFLAVESEARVYAFALNDDGSYAWIATIDSGLDSVAELEYDTATDTLLVVCDEVCEGRVAAFTIFEGAFQHLVTYARPAGMANIANEGFALAASCVNGSRAAYWADDADTDGFSLRAGTYDCTASADPIVIAQPSASVPSRQLAETGADASGLAVIGTALLMLGVGTVSMRRRRLNRG